MLAVSTEVQYLALIAVICGMLVYCQEIMFSSESVWKKLLWIAAPVITILLFVYWRSIWRFLN